MGSGALSKPALPACEDDPLRESCGLNKSSMASHRISEMFKMAPAVPVIGTGLNSLADSDSGNSSSGGCDDDGFQSIMIAAVPNHTIKDLLRTEQQNGAFSRYIKRHHCPGPALEYLNHVVSIEKFKRANCEATTIHREFVRMRSFYQSRASEKRANFPNHASVHILKTLGCTEEVDLAETEDLKFILFRSQEEIIGMLAPIIAEFVFTPYYSQEMEAQSGPSQDREEGQSAASSPRQLSSSRTAAPVAADSQLFVNHHRTNKELDSSKRSASNPYTAALEASVASVLHGRFKEALMAPFELDDILSNSSGGGRSTAFRTRRSFIASTGPPYLGAC